MCWSRFAWVFVRASPLMFANHFLLSRVASNFDFGIAGICAMGSEKGVLVFCTVQAGIDRSRRHSDTLRRGTSAGWAPASCMQASA